MRTIILGLGNILFTDDGVGILVARALKNRVLPKDVTVSEATIGGLDVIDNISGYERAIIIDAIQTAQGDPGSIYCLDLNQFPTSKEFSQHDINVLTAIKLGKKLGMELPEAIIIFAIETEDIISIKEECTPEVQSAIPICIELIIQQLQIRDAKGQYSFEK